MRPIVIGIAGGTGSGKTTVAQKLVRALPHDAAVGIQHDWYYLDRSHLTPEQRAHVNFDEPDALDNARLIDDLCALREGRAAECPQYDFATHTRSASGLHVEPCAVVVVEGILLFAVEALRNAFDLRIFVDTDDDIRLLRRIRRDIEERGRDIASIDAQYRGTVRPMHERYVAPSRRYAHLIIPEGGDNAAALDVIVGRLLYFLAGPATGSP
jgi:uridine kinase